MDVSIIIVSYNTKHVLSDCLNSIQKYVTNLSFEIIVVDNGSTDGSREYLAKLSKLNKIKLTLSKKNLGFGGANNLGAKQAKGSYILFLNPDTLFISNPLSSSLDWLKKHPRVGALTVKLLNRDKTTQPTGGYFPSIWRVVLWQFFIEDIPFIGKYMHSIHPHEPGFLFLDRLTKRKRNKTSSAVSIYDSIFYPDWITGAFMLMPSKIFQKTSGFDEKIFMYTEELELCFRVKKMGFSITYLPSKQIIHLVGSSSGSINSLVWEAINTIYFFKKHYSVLDSFIVRVIIILGSLLRLIIFGIVTGDKNKQKAYAQIIQKLI